MSNWKLKTPVAFLIFNRPDTTQRVFAEIAKAKPPKLLVVADGPRENKPGEAQRCAETRAIIDQVDWDCEVLTNFSDKNLGCKKRVSSGIDWVFEQVEEAIILEDDCLPHPTFFRFCQELLEYYRDDERISMISGDNFQFGRKRGDASYYYSRFIHIWGWASWRRAWKHYDSEIRIWPEIKETNTFKRYFHKKSDRKYWSRVFDAVYQGRIDTWDYQWVLSSWVQGMVSVMPNVNLVSNIGFGNNATHTHGASIYADLPSEEIKFPLTHPNVVLANFDADAFTTKGMFTYSLLLRILHKLRAIIKKMLASR